MTPYTVRRVFDHHGPEESITNNFLSAHRRNRSRASGDTSENQTRRLMFKPSRKDREATEKAGLRAMIDAEATNCPSHHTSATFADDDEQWAKSLKNFNYGYEPPQSTRSGPNASEQEPTGSAMAICAPVLS